MTKWLRRNSSPVVQTTTTVAGLALVTAAAFTVALGLGLLVAGVACLLGGWYHDQTSGGAR
jgi:hypothetical protein